MPPHLTRAGPLPSLMAGPPRLPLAVAQPQAAAHLKRARFLPPLCRLALHGHPELSLSHRLQHAQHAQQRIPAAIRDGARGQVKLQAACMQCSSAY